MDSGFLTNNGIEKIRSGFANDIYADELHHICEQQTDLRNLLKKESEQMMKSLAKGISENKNFNAELLNLVAKLHNQLAESKGKKVYGYLKSDIKKTVDEIFARLADNESVKKMYYLWCEMEQQKHDVYSSAKVDFPSLVDNKEFRSVKNMIVQTVLHMELQASELVAGMSESDVEQGSKYGQIIPDNQENEMFANTIFSLFVNLSRCIEDDYHRKFQSGRKMIDSKLIKVIQEKKQSLGVKHENSQTQEY